MMTVFKNSKNDLGLTIKELKEFIKDKDDSTIILMWNRTGQGYDSVRTATLVENTVLDNTTGQILKAGSILLEDQ